MNMITLEQLDEKLDARFAVIDDKFTALEERLEKKFDEKIDNLAGMMAQGFTELRTDLKTDIKGLDDRLRNIEENYATKDGLRNFAEKIESNFRYISVGI
jgi:hypothetical protein